MNEHILDSMARCIRSGASVQEFRQKFESELIALSQLYSEPGGLVEAINLFLIGKRVPLMTMGVGRIPFVEESLLTIADPTLPILLTVGDPSLSIADGIASLGFEPYEYSIYLGSLPSGLTLDPASGGISGILDDADSGTFQVLVSDDGGNLAFSSIIPWSVDYPLVFGDPSISSNLSTGSVVVVPTDISGGSLPYIYSIVSGSLPVGLTLDPTTGEISGTISSVGTGTFVVDVTDAKGRNQVSNIVNWDVDPPLLITDPLVPVVLTIGDILSITNGTATGGELSYTYSVQSGTLPSGLSLNSTTGEISGTLTTNEAGTFVIRVTDSDGRTADTVTINYDVDAVLGINDPAFNAQLETGSAVALTTQTTGSGGETPYTFSVQAGTLPTGATINTSTGVISGTLTTVESGTVTIRVTDSDGRTIDSASVPFDVDAPLTLADPTLPGSMSVGQSLNVTDGVAAGGETSAAYTYTVQSGALPSGSSLNAATGAITGALTTAESGSFTIRVTDADGRTADSSSIPFTVALSLAIADPTVSTTLEVADVVSITDGVASGGTAPFTYTVQSGALPSGTTLNATTGEISGTLTTAEMGTFVIRVTDNLSLTADTNTIAFDIDGTYSIADPTIPATPTVGDVVSITDGVTTGGETPIVYSVLSGALPSGTTLNTSTGEISGTLTTVESGTFVIRGTDADGRTVDTSSITFDVDAVLSMADPILGNIYIDGGTFSNTTGVASGGETAYTYSLQSGTLPTGLALDASTGAITGTATNAAESGNIVVRVTDADGRTADSASVAYATIAAIAITTSAAFPTVMTVGTALAGQTDPVATGGEAPLTWSVGGGALPVGVTLNASTGVLSGTPTTPQNGSVLIMVTDNNGMTDLDTIASYDVDAVLTIAAPTMPTSLTVGEVVSVTDGVGSGGESPLLGMTDPTIPAGFAVSDVISITDGVAINGTGPFTYSVQSGTLPSGLSLNTTTGEISGTLTTAETGTFVIRVTDSATDTADSTAINFTVVV